MTATSPSVAEIAAKGMTKALTRAEQKSVCASALNQREYEASRRKIVTAYRRLGNNLTLENLEKLGALLFPEK